MKQIAFMFPCKYHYSVRFHIHYITNVGAGLERVTGFLHKLTAEVRAALLPGSPHARQHNALDLTTTLLDVWDDRVGATLRQFRWQICLTEISLNIQEF